MIDIRPLQEFSVEDTARIAPGYTSPIAYAVTATETADSITISLTRATLDTPYVKSWEFDPDDMARYRQVLTESYSLGAYDGEVLVGFVLVEPRRWNGSLWVWEFHVAPTHQRLGIGRRLMDALATKGAADGFRTIVCEAQNTNGIGIDAYRALGFRIEAVDLSYYTNNDYPDGEMAVFMKRPIA